MLKYKIEEKKYKNQTILKDIDFLIRNGQSILIVGPSGTGKTTLLKCILGKTNYTGNMYSGEEKRNIIQYVSQECTLDFRDWVFASIYEKTQLAHPSWANNDKIAKYCESIMKSLNIWNIRFQSLNKLSGGQQKRVQLAQTLVQQYDLLIADEIDSGLDPLTAYEILSDLTSICRNENKKLILVSHTSSKETICLFDKILILGVNKKQQSTLMYFGSPLELKKEFGSDSLIEIYKLIQSKNTAKQEEKCYEKFAI